MIECSLNNIIQIGIEKYTYFYKGFFQKYEMQKRVVNVSIIGVCSIAGTFILP